MNPRTVRHFSVSSLIAAIVVEQVGFYKILLCFRFLQDGGVVFYALKGM